MMLHFNRQVFLTKFACRGIIIRYKKKNVNWSILLINNKFPELKLCGSEESWYLDNKCDQVKLELVSCWITELATERLVNYSVHLRSQGESIIDNLVVHRCLKPWNCFPFLRLMVPSQLKENWKRKKKRELLTWWCSAHVHAKRIDLQKQR